MITIKSGPGFDEARTLAAQLEASLYLLRPGNQWTDEAMERAHVWIELMLLEEAEK